MLGACWNPKVLEIHHMHHKSTMSMYQEFAPCDAKIQHEHQLFPIAQTNQFCTAHKDL
jgi:hypothetical protein